MYDKHWLSVCYYYETYFIPFNSPPPKKKKNQCVLNILTCRKWNILWITIHVWFEEFLKMNGWTNSQSKCNLHHCQYQILIYMSLLSSWLSFYMFCRGSSTQQASTRRSQLLYHSPRNWTWRRLCPPPETIPMATGIKLYRNLPKVFHVIISKPWLLSSL